MSPALAKEPMPKPKPPPLANKLRILTDTTQPPYSEQSTEGLKSWFVLRVETSREFLVEQHLNWRGLECFVPSFQLVRRLSHRKPEVLTRALLPGYALVSMALESRKLAVTCPHALELLSFGGVPAYLDSNEMSTIRSLGTQTTAEPWQSIPDGAKVRVKEGPFAGKSGILLKHKNEWRFVLSIEMLSRYVSVEIDGWAVEKEN